MLPGQGVAPVSDGAAVDGGVARLSGWPGERVRSVFFDDDAAGADPEECPAPNVPGDGPRPFEE